MTIAELFPLNPLSDDYKSKIEVLLEDKWLRRKVNRSVKIIDEMRYLDLFFPEIKKGGLNVLDIGCGFGVFIELARYFKCDTTGTHHDYSAKVFSYNEYCKLMFDIQKLNIINLDLYDILKNNKGFIDKKFDIINCKHAINLIFLKHFDFEKNNWIFSDELKKLTNRFFALCNNMLNKNGILVIAALKSGNKKKYTNLIKKKAKKNNFKLLINKLNIAYKFIKE